MGLFDKLRGRRRTRGATANDPAADLRYLRQWIVEHRGDGEWTRRRTGGDAGARRLSHRLKMPVYDVQKVGYPQRMRDYDARRRIERKRAAREELER